MSRAGASDEGDGRDMIVDAFGDLRDRQTVLSDELHHRVQNTLAIVLALARLTARSVTTIEEFQVAFCDRVQAMARTNALLQKGQAQAITVQAALETELEPFCGGPNQLTLACEAISVPADSALSLSLLIHELTTNAVKYGALSARGGRLAVRCARGDSDVATLDWQEHCPRETAVEQRRGAGSLLIERLARDLGGTAQLELRPEGFRARVVFRLDPLPLG